MNGNNLVALVCLGVAGFIFYPKVKDYLPANKPSNPTVVVPVVTPDASLQTLTGPLITKLAGQPEAAAKFADFYRNLKDSLVRDTNNVVYPTTERFRVVHATALTSAFVGTPNAGFGIGADVDAILINSLGGLEQKSITPAERASLMRALDTIIWAMQQVK